MTKQKIDVASILNTLAVIRQQIPHLAAPPTHETPGAATFLGDSDEAMEAFEMETLAGALESFTSELSDSVRTAQQKLMAQALEIYYAAEKLTEDPEHARLIPYVKQMRAAYRRDFGTDIPER